MTDKHAAATGPPLRRTRTPAILLVVSALSVVPALANDDAKAGTAGWPPPAGKSC